MKPNEGSADRAIRVFAGIAFLVVAIFGAGMFQGQIAGIALGVVGLVSLITGAVGFCPAYAIVGVGTCEVEKM
ncbi:MAG: DUF2892 domain-containing protein [Leptolyngbya sp. PLA3]|nr:MAG: DUF2892 domain-containing protein [Cyanobacteria bacterium CYA]MCE7968928.1 DUF2892 domain-containing protein [Leptolyngbya sp. PL-A3]